MSYLSYSHGASADPLIGQTIGSYLQGIVERFPSAPALVIRHQHYRATYRQLWHAVTDCALGLLACGIHKDDRVGIWSPNRFEWVVLQYATARIGAILVNVNPSYQTPELEFALQQSGIRMLFHADGFRQSRYVEMIDTIRSRCPELESTVHLDVDWQPFLAQGKATNGEALACREKQLDCDDPINIQYTSGTTGFPKGATLSHHNLLNNAYSIANALGYSEIDRVCVPVPFYHCFGMVLGNLACMTRTACVVVPAESFHPRSVLETISAERCTSLYGVPTMFRAVLEDPEFDRFNVSSLRTGVMAGAPCPIELMREVVNRLHMPEVAIGYGMTETSPISTFTARDDSMERRVGTVGRVFPHVEVSIRDTQGTMVPRGQPGELCTRGYSVMRGYWNNPEATTASIDQAGWMHSGDLAVMDEDGYIRIVGRLKDMIIRGGENIYPAEIEAVLHTHPDISEAHVVGVPSRRYGEEVMAWLRHRPGVDLTESDMAQFCQRRLAAYKVPKFWCFVDEFPMTVTGKVQKFRLREWAITRLQRELEIEKTA